MHATDLTKQQYRVLRFLFEFMQSNPTVPTWREIQTEFGFRDVSTVRDHLKALTVKGYVTSTGQHRGLRLVKSKTNKLFGMPVLKSIGAGPPKYLDDEVLRFISPAEGIPANADYGFVVRGESMTPTINPGDEVFIQEKNCALNPGIVAATIEEHGTVQGVIKRLVQCNGEWKLVSDNPFYPSYELDEVQLVGRVVEIRRRV